jgi:hypothetical protein
MGKEAKVPSKKGKKKANLEELKKEVEFVR